MKVTRVTIRVGSNLPDIKAFASIVIDGCFVIDDLALVDRATGYVIRMPGRKRPMARIGTTLHIL